MSSEAVKIARIAAKQQGSHDLVDVVKAGSSAAKDLAIAAISNPLFSLIGANVAVELIQRVMVHDHFETQWFTVPDPNNPGMEHQEERQVSIETPLMSQALGTTIQTIINTNAALEAIGGLGYLSRFIGVK